MKNIKKNLALIMACIFFIGGGTFSTTVEAASVYNKRLSVQRNNRIESIIEKYENEELAIRATNTRKIEKFFDTTDCNALQDKTEKEIESYFATVKCGSTAQNNTKGGIITNPVTYLHNTVAKSTDKYTVTTTKVVSGVGSRTCTNLGGHNNCTLTSLYNIMVHYRTQGYRKIPTTQSELYLAIKKQATTLGYDYSKSKGLSVTKNNNFVKNTWRKGFGYTSGNGYNNYAWTANSAISEINSNRPFMFSVASGIYFDHTVTVYGYKIYKNNRTGKKYTFLMLRDGWSNSVRYLAWSNTGASYVACLTSVKAPSTK